MPQTRQGLAPQHKDIFICVNYPSDYLVEILVKFRPDARKIRPIGSLNRDKLRFSANRLVSGQLTLFS